MINVVCGIKSTGRICTDLAETLKDYGHEVMIAYGREQVPDRFQNYALRIGTDFDVNKAAIEARLFDNAGYSNKSTTRRFVKWIENYNPDVIHLHNIHGYYLNVEILFMYLKMCNKKVIWTLHDCWAFTGHTPYCDVINCRRWVKGCFSCPLKSCYPKAFIDRSKFNWINKKRTFCGVKNMTLVTPSKWLSNELKQSFLSQYKAVIINNGIDTNVFKYHPNHFREKHKLEKKYVVLGVSTSWDDMKGLSDYIALSEMLSDDFKVVLVGIKREQKDKIPSRMLGIERTSSLEELVDIYSSADLYLNLSYCENYPTVNLEAVSCGIPLLTYDTGGSSEVAEITGGIVVKRGDLNGVALKIVEARDKKLKLPMLDLKQFDVSYEISKYLQLYNED